MVPMPPSTSSVTNSGMLADYRSVRAVYRAVIPAGSHGHLRKVTVPAVELDAPRAAFAHQFRLDRGDLRLGGHDVRHAVEPGEGVELRPRRRQQHGPAGPPMVESGRGG